MTTKEDRENLRTNKYGPVLQLWLDGKSKNDAMRHALKSNTTVTTVSVFVEEDFVDSPPEHLAGLFRAIGGLPLTNLYIYSFGRNFDPFPVQLLIDVIQRAKMLEVLTVYFVELDGKRKHFDAFEKSLRGHPSLREFRLENCRFPDEYLNTKYSRIDHFIKTLAALPKIEKVDLWATDMGFLGTMTNKSLEALASSQTFTSLSLVNFALDNGHVQVLSDVLKTNPGLTEISLSCDPEFCSALAPMLATNKTLTQVKVRLETLEDDMFLQTVAQGLKENKSIIRFDLLGEIQNIMSVKSQKAFADILEKNSTLEHMDVEFTDEDCLAKAHFYLKLNQTGKRGLMENPHSSKDDLVNALAHVGDDLDCLNHFLGTKPTLVHD